MSNEPESKALDAIHNEAARLLNLVPSSADPELAGGLHLIVALARYKIDVRSVEEIIRAKGGT